ncbi:MULTISPECIES: cytochrome P450 [unclassified Novosphingobium]|uniref:cytochrome P450 n=1 Tax=unclassified Novosphingobium TaxID=2644732 RepID=UPI0006C86A08|nr:MULTISPECIES: cytochrome P450 [unclassified Novosphingobium]KPH59923.1 cytochrome P450 [Novosphingobium sp. ST904]MPS67063.1 cytochrome P450 [Novosphingobium sp.]TCM39914.1 cytochrome P450 [Novosphingobium sp. ST904]WRT94133.1 cytochrome P450 [Novosphingobium sp. RL4]
MSHQQAYETADWYTDVSLVDDPHAYFDYLRAQGPVVRLPYRNAVAVTGYDETVQIMLDTEHFSSINAVTGPVADLPFRADGDDISEKLEAHRRQIPFADQIVTEGGARHADLRSIIARLFTPSRLKDLQPKLLATAESLIDEFARDGKVDLVRQYGGPYGALVISDLLGLSERSRAKFRALLEGAIPVPMDASEEDMLKNPLVGVGKDLFRLIAQRRIVAHPLMKPLHGLLAREDILSELATASYPDGGKPSLVDLTSLAAFLFGAGQDTTNRLLANAFRIIATRPDIQQELRGNRARIGDFVEEVLRFDGSVKSGGRMCQKTTTLGGVEIKAGTAVLLSHMAANRDPRRFAEPGQFDMDRPRIKEHLAFGRGAHTCIGAPLARREVVTSIERLLARMGNIRLSEAHHGPAEALHFDYEPTYILRALAALHLEFDPIEGD